jgi:hypothetical protein
MDQTQLQQKIAEYYQKLPKELQEIFSSMEWLKKLEEVSQKYGLSEKQIETLGTETTLVLLGIIHEEEYEDNIKKEIALPQASMENLMLEINNSILKNIKPQLTEVFKTNNNGEVKIEEKWKEAFEKLPEETKNAITHSDYQKKLYEIGSENNLTINEMGDLAEYTNKIIFGEIRPDTFESYIKTKIIRPDEIIKKIVNEVNDLILKNIREQLMNSTVREDTKDKEILSSAGIEILESTPELTSGITKKEVIEDREKLLKKIENPPKTPSIFTQKLAGSFKMPIVETEHTLNNLSKDTATVPVKASSEKTLADPYREIPE